MTQATRFKNLMTAWFILAAGAAGLMIGLLTGVLAIPKDNEIICPPVIDAAVKFRLFYSTELEQIPQPGPLDYEFLEACGFTKFDSPKPVVTSPPEEGGA